MEARRRHRRQLVFALVVGLALCQANRADAARFSVNPTQVFLSSGTTSALVSLKNDSEEPLRFQLTLFAWDQSPDGEMKLEPTEDIVFFPQMLTLGAREEREVRVGALLPPGAVEKTYRLFVEELPASEAARPAGEVRVLTRMGMPIFVRPAHETQRCELRDLAYVTTTLSFALANTGTVHLVPEGMVVRALAPDGQTVGEQPVSGWYILSGGSRRFSVDLSGLPLDRAAAISVEARVGSTVLTQRLDLGIRAAR